MSYFKAKMHQIRFRLGLRPTPRRGVHSAPPDPLTGFEGVLLLREGKGMGGKGMGKKRKKGGMKGREKGREGEGREGEGYVMAFGGMDAPGSLCYVTTAQVFWRRWRARSAELRCKSNGVSVPAEVTSELNRAQSCPGHRKHPFWILPQRRRWLNHPHRSSSKPSALEKKWHFSPV